MVQADALLVNDPFPERQAIEFVAKLKDQAHKGLYVIVETGWRTTLLEQLDEHKMFQEVFRYKSKRSEMTFIKIYQVV